MVTTDLANNPLYFYFIPDICHTFLLISMKSFHLISSSLSSLVKAKETWVLFLHSSIISASLHVLLIGYKGSLGSQLSLLCFIYLASSQSETAWLAGPTVREQMKMWLWKRKRTGPVNSAPSSTSRQQKHVMLASLQDQRVSEMFCLVFCFWM